MSNTYRSIHIGAIEWNEVKKRKTRTRHFDQFHAECETQKCKVYMRRMMQSNVFIEENADCGRIYIHEHTLRFGIFRKWIFGFRLQMVRIILIVTVPCDFILLCAFCQRNVQIPQPTWYLNNNTFNGLKTFFVRIIKTSRRKFI